MTIVMRLSHSPHVKSEFNMNSKFVFSKPVDSLKKHPVYTIYTSMVYVNTAAVHRSIYSIFPMIKITRSKIGYISQDHFAVTVRSCVTELILQKLPLHTKVFPIIRSRKRLMAKTYICKRQPYTFLKNHNIKSTL